VAVAIGERRGFPRKSIQLDRGKESVAALSPDSARCLYPRCEGGQNSDAPNPPTEEFYRACERMRLAVGGEEPDASTSERSECGGGPPVTEGEPNSTQGTSRACRETRPGRSGHEAAFEDRSKAEGRDRRRAGPLPRAA